MDRVERAVTVAVALGSNVGDRAAHLQRAIDRLNRIFTHLRISRFYETEPVGASDGQGLYLNAAAVGRTSSTPRDLLRALLEIERQCGRERPYPNAPRSLDLDLILYGSAIVDSPELVVPHPRFRERAFVLEPLDEIAPQMRDPATGLTVKELLSRLKEKAPG